ncbi:MAG: hypothetical protein U0V54_12125 [Saprospiraceae bacterium]
MQKEEKIQTLHPQEGKTNKSISRAKYEVIKSNLINILESGPINHTDLMETLYNRTHANFDGGVQWYGETVKLDLEARGVIERTNDKPQKYKLKSK